jgi:pyrimidine operon attenuation protein/uracil phosphoribosyltransferase
MDDPMTVILDAKQIEKALQDLSDQIVSCAAGNGSGEALAVIGIRSRGEILAQHIAGYVSQQLGKSVPCGTLDITLYRDDLNSPHKGGQPLVRTTEIGFSIDDRTIILVDDVLYTGRSARAAMSALMDLGRPRVIRLAVLVERSGRELPIQADFVGYRARVEPDQSIQVNLVESDGKNEVVVE